MDSSPSMATRSRTAAANASPRDRSIFTSYSPRGLVSQPDQQAVPLRRTVASAAQLVVLRMLYDRAGDDATKAEIEEVSRETGLQPKWIRKWISRQRKSGGPRRRQVSPAAGAFTAVVPPPSRHQQGPSGHSGRSSDSPSQHSKSGSSQEEHSAPLFAAGGTLEAHGLHAGQHQQEDAAMALAFTPSPTMLQTVPHQNNFLHPRHAFVPLPHEDAPLPFALDAFPEFQTSNVASIHPPTGPPDIRHEIGNYQVDHSGYHPLAGTSYETALSPAILFHEGAGVPLRVGTPPEAPSGNLSSNADSLLLPFVCDSDASNAQDSRSFQPGCTHLDDTPATLQANADNADSFAAVPTPIAFQIRVADLWNWTRSMRGLAPGAEGNTCLGPALANGSYANLEPENRQGELDALIAAPDVQLTPTATTTTTEAPRDVQMQTEESFAEKVAKTLRDLDNGYACAVAIPRGDETDEDEEVVTPGEEVDFSLGLHGLYAKSEGVQGCENGGLVVIAE